MQCLVSSCEFRVTRCVGSVGVWRIVPNPYTGIAPVHSLYGLPTLPRSL